MEYFDSQLEEKEELQEELIRALRKSKLGRKLISFLVILAFVLITVMMAWLFGRSQAKRNAETEILELQATVTQLKDQMTELINTPMVVSAVSPEIVLDIIRSEIDNIGELATIEYLFTDSAKFSDSKQIKKWNVPFTEKTFILKWDGTIKAGIDLKTITYEVNENDKVIMISIPKAKILSYEIDVNSVEVLDEKDNIFNPITVGDKIDFDAKTEEAMKNRAIENGILDKAMKNAQDIISRMITVNPQISENYSLEFNVIDK